MRCKISQVGEAVLRKQASPLTAEQISSPEIGQLIEWMRETMRDAPGVGLAAPQVGISIQLAVIEDRAEFMKDVGAARLAERGRSPVPFHVIINPRITARSERQVEFFEGCLSLAGFTALVPRAHAVTADFLDEHGKSRSVDAQGWYARILQHEIDHLHGTLYIDRMVARSFTSVDNLNRHWKDLPIADVRKALGLDGAGA